jgi:amidase
VENCVSRSVRDSAMVFSLSQDNSDSATLKPTGFIAGPRKKRLRIAFATETYYGNEPHPDVKAAVEATATLCRDLGHEFIDANNPVHGEAFVDAFLTVWASGPAELVKVAESHHVRPQDVLEPWTVSLADYFFKKPKGALEQALAVFRDAEAQVDSFFSNYDVWLMPVLAAPQSKLGEQAPTVAFKTLYERVTRYVAYTPIHNAAGTPAMTVPLAMSGEGLPIGSQFAAARGCCMRSPTNSRPQSHGPGGILVYLRREGLRAEEARYLRVFGALQNAASKKAKDCHAWPCRVTELQ